MKKNVKNHKLKVHSVSNDNKLIKQETLTIQQHQVEKQWLLLSNNNFNGSVYCPGYFNRKTNFIVGDVRSIMGYDVNLNELDNSSTSSMFKQDGYIIYPIPCFHMKNNEVLDYKSPNGIVEEISLDFDLGYKIGEILTGTTNYKISGFLQLFIDTSKGYSLNKNILLNTNYKFILAILKGYYERNNDNGFFINNNLNIYTISTMLNYLGASYSIRNSKDRKKVYIQLPEIFKGLINNKFIRDNILPDSDCELSNKVKSGTILMIPFSSIILEQSSDNKMYDLTSERSDATNYALNMTPIMKNSDGDILAASGIFTKEGLKDSKPFSPDVKEYYKNLNDGNINQWIADDAILGLYNSTSHK